MANPVGGVGGGNISKCQEKSSFEDDARVQETSRQKGAAADVCMGVRKVSLEIEEPEADWFELRYQIGETHEMLEKFTLWSEKGYGRDKRFYNEEELKIFSREKGIRDPEQVFGTLSYYFEYLLSFSSTSKKKGIKKKGSQPFFFLPVAVFNLWHGALLYHVGQYDQSESCLLYSLSMVESETPAWFMNKLYSTLYIVYYKKGDLRQMMNYLKLAGNYDSADGILTWALVRVGLLDGCEKLADPFALVNLKDEASALIKKGEAFRTSMDVGWAVGASWESVIDMVLSAGATEEALSAATSYIRWKNKRVEFLYKYYSFVPEREKQFVQFFSVERERLAGIHKKVLLIDDDVKKARLCTFAEKKHRDMTAAYAAENFSRCLTCFQALTRYLFNESILSEREQRVLNTLAVVLKNKDLDKFICFVFGFFKSTFEDSRCIKNILHMLSLSQEPTVLVEETVSKKTLHEILQCFVDPGGHDMPASLMQAVARSAGKDEWSRDFFRTLIGGGLPVDPQRALLYARLIQCMDPAGFVLEAIAHILLRSPRNKVIEVLLAGIDKGSAAAALMLGDFYAGKYPDFKKRELELAFKYFDMAGNMGLATGYIRAADLIIERSKGKMVFFETAADLFRQAFQMLSDTLLTDEARYCTTMIDLCDAIVSTQNFADTTSHSARSTDIPFPDEGLSSEAGIDLLVESKDRPAATLGAALLDSGEVAEVKDDESSLVSAEPALVEKQVVASTTKPDKIKKAMQRRELFERFRLINQYIDEGEFNKASESLKSLESKILKSDKYAIALQYDIWARFYKANMENIVPASRLKRDKVVFVAKREGLFLKGVSCVKKGLKEMSVKIGDDMTLLNEDVFTKLSASEKRLVASLCSLWGHLLSLQAQLSYSEKIKKLYERIYRLAYRFNPEKQYKRAVSHEGKVRVIDEEIFQEIYRALKE